MADFDVLPSGFALPGNTGWAKREIVIDTTTTIATGGLAAGKSNRVSRAPKGFVLTGYRIDVTDADTNGSPAITQKLGDAGDDDRIMAAATIGQAGGSSNTLASTGFLYEYTADTDILLTTGTAAATAAAQTVKLALFGYMK